MDEDRVESYRNASYSLDLNSYDIFHFPKMKNQLREIRFNNDNEMLDALNNILESLTKEDFQNCSSDWFSRMHNCIDATRKYLKERN